MRRFSLLVPLLVPLLVGPAVVGRGSPTALAQEGTPSAEDGAPAAAPAAAEGETLLEVTLPADALPRGDAVSSGLAHVTVPPGHRSTWAAAAGAAHPGSRLEYVLAGTYAVRAEGEVRVLRGGGGGAPETVPAGTAVELGPGDALVSRAETGYEAANPGAGPLELLAWVVVAGIPARMPGPGGWVFHEHDLQEAAAAPPVPAGPATLRLRRVELAPDATLPPPVGAARFFVTLPTNAAGTPVVPSIGQRSDGTIRNVGRDVTPLYVLTLEPARGAVGSPVAGSPGP